MTEDARRRVKRYLDRSTRGLWGRGRAVVREELAAHIEGRVAASLLEGMSEADAVDAALCDLGEAGRVNSGMAEIYATPVVLGAALVGAWRQIRLRPVESFLIVVAIALGVGVVIAVASFLRLEDQLADALGSPLEARELSVQAVENDDQAFTRSDTPQAVRLGEAGPTFDIELLGEIREAAPAVDHAYVKEADIVRSASSRNLQDGVIVFGVSEEFLEAAMPKVVHGSAFTASEVREQAEVVVLTREAVERLGIEGDPLGQAVRKSDSTAEYRIVGIIESPMSGRGETGYLPFPPGTSPRFLYFAVDDHSKVEDARVQIADYVQERWGGRVTVAAQPGVSRLSEAQRLTATALAGFAAVGLVVASLNIMNLMLARVARRGKQISTKRSLGATRGDVRKELLVEGALLGLLGGTVGAFMGSGLLWVYNSTLALASGGEAFGIRISIPTLGLGLLIAVGASLVFSLYPAVVASRQDIVLALKES